MGRISLGIRESLSPTLLHKIYPSQEKDLRWHPRLGKTSEKNQDERGGKKGKKTLENTSDEKKKGYQ